MVFKLMGVCCILGASLLTGESIKNRLKHRVDVLRETREILDFLEKEMTYHKSPLPEAFRSAAKRASTEVKQVLMDVAVQIEAKDGRSFSVIWEGAVERNMPHGILPKAEIEQMKGIAGALCNADTVLQRTLLLSSVNRFQEMSDEAAQDCREKCMLYRKLAAAAGVFLIILLL